jgi:hypothetical protein
MVLVLAHVHHGLYSVDASLPPDSQCLPNGIRTLKFLRALNT